MFFKYRLLHPTDYRGNVKLVVKVDDAEIAYSNVTNKDPDMVPLTQREVELVLQESPGTWFTEREEFQRRVDALADDVRASYLYNGKSTISEEYRHVEKVALDWIAAGADESNVPSEIAVWAKINQQTAMWSAQSVITASEFYRGAISQIRNLRLLAKHDIRNATTEAIPTIYAEFETTINQLRCPIEY